jgi:flagellar hook-associated protein 1 FlgK
MDKQNALIEQLSKIVKIEVHGTTGSNMIISVGGRALVQGDFATKVTVNESPTGWQQVAWADDGSAIGLNGGELQGLTDLRDNVCEGYISSLDTMAKTLVDRVNAYHTTGVDLDGNPADEFFTPGTGAADISISDAIIASPSKVAASKDNTVGNNEIADAVYNVQNEALIEGKTISTAYTQFVTRVGSDTQEAKMRTSAHETSFNQRQAQRESMVGVSMDEEMANMIKFQQSYNAAARIFTTMDEMLQTLMSM